jgi:glycosyltransferase involved in cell wall biosynthesis
MCENFNIFCVGEYGDGYRTQNTLKTFLNNRRVNIFYNDFPLPDGKISSKIYKLFVIINSIFYMVRADLIYVFAMQHGHFLMHLFKFFRKKVITDFFLSFYDTETNDYKRYAPRGKASGKLKKIDINAIKYSNTVFFLTEAERDYYSKILNIPINNYKILPLCIERKEFARLNYYKNNNNCLNLCWCGSYVPLQGLDIILRAVSLLKDHFNFHFYIWGHSDERFEPYKKIISDLSIEDKITVHNEWGDRTKWEDFIVNTCDITLGIFGNSSKAKTVLANKVIDGVAFKTPVITAPSDGLFNFFNGKDDIYITENNPEALAFQIESLAKADYSEIRERIENSYKVYDTIFTPEKFGENLMRFLNESTEKTIKKNITNIIKRP